MTVAVCIARWAFLGLLVVSMSCSGGTGGTGSPVVAVGAVTAVGSIVVNGIRFDTTGATITFDGQRGSEADLRVGQVVMVQGTLAPGGTVGTAETVVVDTQATGPVASIDLSTNRLVVLGQTVRVESTTQFGATPLNALAVGNIVALSGFADAEGVLRATRIEKTQDAFTPGTRLETAGVLTNLDAAQRTFTLHTLQVDFSAAQLPALSVARLRAGQVVEVRSVQDVLDGVLLASSVAVREPGILGPPGEAVEFEGIITRVTAPDAFEVNGQPVRLTPSTVLVGGTTADIALNARLEVEGVFDAAGSIVGEEVEFGAGIERRGIITRVTAADTFEVDGQPVRFTPATVFRGGTAADIVLNRSVEVEGLFAPDGSLVATEIEFL